MQKVFDFIYGFLAIIFIAIWLMFLMDHFNIVLPVLFYSISGIFVYSVFRVIDHYRSRIRTTNM